MNLEKHEMILENAHSTGAEEWFCPTCGRRMTITWQPWKKIVLEQGDLFATHSASKGGLQIASVDPTQGNNGEQRSATEEPPIEDRYLAPWLAWLENVNLDDLGNGDD